jgi:hypothetical protein
MYVDNTTDLVFHLYGLVKASCTSEVKLQLFCLSECCGLEMY